MKRAINLTFRNHADMYDLFSELSSTSEHFHPAVKFFRI